MKNIIVRISKILILMVLLSGCSVDRPHIENVDCMDIDSSEDTVSGENACDNAGTTVKQESVCVYICGHVRYPGVYELTNGSRLIDAIEMAGGLTDDADALAINMAMELCDGEQYIIYSQEEYALINETESEQLSHYDTEGRLNINIATIDELMELPGVGKVKAEAIIAYREENGCFSNCSELMNVSGIGNGLYDNIKNEIYTE